MKKLIIIFTILFLTSCSLLEKGYYNEYGQYVPKKPDFKLKDRNGVFPEQLDTNGVYKLDKMYVMGELVFPVDTYDENDNYYYWKLQMKSMKEYMRFFPNGRCFSYISKNIKNKNEISKSRKSEIDPNQNNVHKMYFYSPDGNKILIESFVYGFGYGDYLIFEYELSKSGDTLITRGPVTEYFVRQDLPESWKNFEVDW